MNDFANLSLSDRKIIVGVDFGTTYSGLAWAETRRPDHIIVIDSWPSKIGALDGKSSAKVPSELRYTPDGYQWGFQMPPIVERYQWFKLGLNENASRLRFSSEEANRDPEKLLQDYLTALRQHLTYNLEKNLGAGFRTIPIEYVVTVPAIWSDLTKARTLAACEAAGFETDKPVLFVSEPEAAAFYALHRLDSHALKVGDSFVLCDAGGGTVDLISYTITKLSPTVEIKEATTGSGGLCGSTFLNRRFADCLISKLSREAGWDEVVLAEAMDRFESSIKKEYSPATYSDGYYNVPVPGLADNENLGIKRGMLHMKLADLESIFEPIVEDIIQLVKDQIKATKKTIKAVLLVGGFGQSSYLKERLQGTLSKETEITQPPNGWTAVVRGAVMKGLGSNLAGIQVRSRVARKHYGIRISVRYDPKRHLEATRFWYPLFGENRAHEMRWFIKKGDPVEESKPSKIRVSPSFLVSKGYPSSHSIKIYCDSTSVEAPIQQNENVTELVQLETYLSSLTSPLRQILGKDGQSYYQLQGVIEIAYGSASTEYTLIHQGTRYKAVTAEYV